MTEPYGGPAPSLDDLAELAHRAFERLP
ncbi:MAG TPA: hypothetical protein PKB04_13930, partial [Phenylobacterium sp.]|nr:hypothetical protein [Phenylobacterium sp.]